MAGGDFLAVDAIAVVTAHLLYEIQREGGQLVRAEKLLVKALNKLPAKQRAVFSMRYYDDMKYEDIAQIMNSSVGSLKASYHIAYQKIKAELKNNSIDF